MDENVNKNVGLKIFNARKNLKMTRAELGKKVGLHESTVKRYEDGQIKSLDIEKIKEFAQALNLDTPLDLLGWYYYDLKYPNIKKEVDFIEKQLKENEQKLLTDFNKLNNLGQKKALEDINDLTQINKYTEQGYLTPIAAHNDNDDPEQQKLMQQDIDEL